MQTTITKILLLKEGTQWVAQCLDLDLCSQGPTIQDALESLERLHEAKRATGGDWLATPAMYHQMLASAYRLREDFLGAQVWVV